MRFYATDRGRQIDPIKKGHQRRSKMARGQTAQKDKSMSSTEQSRRCIRIHNFHRNARARLKQRDSNERHVHRCRIDTKEQHILGACAFTNETSMRGAANHFFAAFTIALHQRNKEEPFGAKSRTLELAPRILLAVPSARGEKRHKKQRNTEHNQCAPIILPPKHPSLHNHLAQKSDELESSTQLVLMCGKRRDSKVLLGATKV